MENQICKHFENGNIIYELYHANGKMHREDGLAYLSYYKDGSIKKQEYYLNGKEYDDVFQYLVMVGSMEV